MAAYLEGFLTRRVGTIVAVVAMTVLAPLAARAQCTVTTLADSPDPGTPGELRYCVDSGAGTIAFSSSLNGGTITVLSTLDITASMTITGPGANLLTISGGNAVQIFSISSGPVTISGLTIANGNYGGSQGGGIFNGGTLTVNNCTFSGNTAKFGGAIFGSEALMVNNSTFSGNTAEFGGGIYVFNGPTVTLSNSTFSGNTAEFGGGIYNAAGTLTVNNSTVSANTATTVGGGIYNVQGQTLTLSDSMVAGNTTTGSPGDDCDGCGTGSYSLISIPSDIINPQLSRLGWYGGSTQTMIPLPGSPAILAGMASATDDPNMDQRGFARATTGVVDVGAVQTNYLIVVTTADTSDASPGCNSTGSGTPCSLRDALTLAASGGTDIAFASGVSGTINLNDLLGISGNLDLYGPGAANLTVSGGHSTGIFVVAPNANATISGITIANGYGYDPYVVGGGIVNNGTLTVSNSTFFGNTAYYYGGAIYNAGTLTVNNSTFSGNTASCCSGGGIINNGATLTVSNSTFSGNTATYRGGGIYELNGTLTLSNSIVAGNTTTDSPGDDCESCGTQSSYNLISTPSAIINPLLAPLDSYGGPTQTMLPLPGSPAICAGSAALDPGPTTDQRGFPRLNTFYTGYSASSPCLDLGADQTNYQSVQFGNPSGYSGTLGEAVSNPAAPLVLVTENGQKIGAVPVTLSFTGGTMPTTVTGAGPVTTVAGSGAQFPALTVRPADDYTLAASLTIVGSVSISANVPLDIAPQVPATVTIKGLSTQSTLVNMAFTTPLAVTVTDANGVLIPNYSGVTFTAASGANGQSGTFANGTDTVTKNTNVNGVATATTFTANNDAGSYKVTVTAGSAHATFTLTNLADTTLSAASLYFGSVAIGETSATQTVTLTNREHIALSFTSIQASAGYEIATNTCGTGIGVAPAACTIGVTFHPTATGADPGTLTFTDNAGNSPQVVNLSGAGEVPVAFSPSTLRFGSVPVNTTSAPLMLTLTNHQNVALTITKIQASAGFGIASTNCWRAIGAADSCTIYVTFSPTAKGDVSGTLTFSDNAGTSPQVVNLSGYGQ